VHRFFAPSLDPGDDSVVLPRGEAEHLLRVLRLGVGDTVVVFDGRGHEYLARVISAMRRDVRVQIVGRSTPAAESSVPLTLAQAVLKGDAMDEVVRDAIMLGVATVQPLVTKRTETSVAALVKGARLERWRRVALASVKQSKRAVLPDVLSPLTLESYLDDARSGIGLMLVEPAANLHVEPLNVLKNERRPAGAVVMVGPEGGWTDTECELAHARGFRLLSLGARTLRADAVPIAAISVLQFLWESDASATASPL
jgi:16S rRNA (uracil1498-N3)-methyltransferase